jgi:hypothetical protein
VISGDKLLTPFPSSFSRRFAAICHNFMRVGVTSGCQDGTATPEQSNSRVEKYLAPLLFLSFSDVMQALTKSLVLLYSFYGVHRIAPSLAQVLQSLANGLQWRTTNRVVPLRSKGDPCLLKK